MICQNADCGKEFVPSHRWQHYCSDVCREEDEATIVAAEEALFTFEQLDEEEAEIEAELASGSPARRSDRRRGRLGLAFA